MFPNSMPQSPEQSASSSLGFDASIEIGSPRYFVPLPSYIRPYPRMLAQPRHYYVDSRCNTHEVFGEERTQTEQLLKRTCKNSSISRYQQLQDRYLEADRFFDALAKPRYSPPTASAPVSYSTGRSLGKPKSEAGVRVPELTLSCTKKGLSSMSNNRSSPAIIKTAYYPANYAPYGSIREIKSRKYKIEAPRVDLRCQPSNMAASRSNSPLAASFKRAVLVYSPSYSGVHEDIWDAKY